MTDFVVAFVGLPSSGKSSIINSLVFKRLLQSGVCRTTTEVKQLEEDIYDDNNNKFKVMDLPGLCDSEEVDNTNFTDITYTNIRLCNLIIWVSDVNKSFITTHEVNEYNKLKKYLKDIEADTGKIYHIIIMLSKCDKDINEKKKVKKKQNTYEIEDSDEDTDISDLINKVKQKFNGEDIILFNAYGRSFYNKNTSQILKTFIGKKGIMLMTHNTTFNITKYISNYKEKQIEAYYKNFINKYDDFINGKINDIRLYWSRITEKQQLEHIILISSKYEDINIIEINFKIFEYIVIVQNNSNFTLPDIVYNILISYYIALLDQNNRIIFCNKYNALWEEYSYLKLNDLILNNLKHISYVCKNKILKMLLFTNNIQTDTDASKIVQNIIKELNIFEIDFKLLFNNFIKETIDKYTFKIVYDKIIQILPQFNNPHEGLIITSPYIIEDNNIYKFFINKLEIYLHDDMFILKNKLDVLYKIYFGLERNTSTCKNITLHWVLLQHNCGHNNYGNVNNDITINHIPYKRLINNSDISDVVKKIYEKIYSNQVLNYDGDYYDFIPINKIELLYDNELEYNECNEESEECNEDEEESEECNEDEEESEECNEDEEESEEESEEENCKKSIKLRKHKKIKYMKKKIRK